MALSFSSSSESESTACRSGYTNEYVDDEDGDDKNSLSNFGNTLVIHLSMFMWNIVVIIKLYNKLL